MFASDRSDERLESRDSMRRAVSPEITKRPRIGTEIMERTRIKHRAKIDFMLRKQLDLKVHADYKVKKSRGKTRARKRKENAVRYF